VDYIRPFLNTTRAVLDLEMVVRREGTTRAAGWQGRHTLVDGDDTTPSSSLASLFLSIDDPLLSGGHRFVRGQSDGV
jgi:hypothetical protein